MIPCFLSSHLAGVRLEASAKSIAKLCTKLLSAGYVAHGHHPFGMPKMTTNILKAGFSRETECATYFDCIKAWFKFIFFSDMTGIILKLLLCVIEVSHEVLVGIQVELMIVNILLASLYCILWKNEVICWEINWCSISAAIACTDSWKLQLGFTILTLRVPHFPLGTRHDLENVAPGQFSFR